jgi:hypothetical protein
MKPYVICHMNTSIDGRTWASRWRPAENRMAGLFERIHEQLDDDCLADHAMSPLALRSIIED